MAKTWERGGHYTTRYSARGTPYQTWEPSVPRIPDTYQECSIYLYPSVPLAEQGVQMGGSGFLLSVKAQTVPGALHIFAVTNAHVIESGSCAVRINTTDGKFDVFDFAENNWLPHPNRDDLAITRMPELVPTKYKFMTVDQEMLLTKEQAQLLNLGPGDEVFLAGRFINSEGKQRNIPTLRFGNISQMPIEPLEQSRAWGKHNQESFLVEAKAISGFSGSPVFTMLMRLYSRQGGKWLEEEAAAGKDLIRLMGCVWGYIKGWEPLCDEKGNPIANKWQVAANTGMMGVVPAWKLQEILDMPEVKKNLAEVEDAFHKKNGPPKSGLATMPVPPGAQTPDAEAGHRERFNRLLAGAVKRPKSSG